MPRSWLSRLKDAVRSPLVAVVARLFRGRNTGLLRDALWNQVRRLDDADGTHRRALMKELFDIEVGRLTYGAFLVDGSIADGTRIGSFCSVAPGIRIGGSNHPLDLVTTHPFIYMANRGLRDSDDFDLRSRLNEPVVIEDDVWLGAYAVVNPGVRIGRGAVVAAGAVVTRDVEPYTIVAGVPAKPVRQRLSPEQIRQLAAIDWPEWSLEKLRSELPLFYDVDAFIAAHGPPEADGRPAAESAVAD